MTISQKEIDKLWKKAKEGVYYDNNDLKNNNGNIKGLKKYNFEGKVIVK